MGLANDKFPSSAAFDAINDALGSSEPDRKDAIKQGNAIFAFTLKNSAGETDSWHIDLKEKGAVAKGTGEKPTGMSPARGVLPSRIQPVNTSLDSVTLSLSDADFGNLVQGKANAQKLFMSGKLKIKGDVMKATRMEPILKKAQSKAKL
ncbi:SCP-2 sterol transfer family protein [Colletotrichum paranaense]|uniref:SCP-2 sterol transfer family protein n=1 Tax=Colletotrichum paranaense TaxID=1914294 RepID=A0ABQ9RZ41_9PEZI|nr:SCP-2 sterol transfer family protein [Colletotrichum paranaense]KAK1519919.1 SCP-2 sterol transfer family protein [Colletotrichum paranaense]